MRCLCLHWSENRHPGQANPNTFIDPHLTDLCGDMPRRAASRDCTIAWGHTVRADLASEHLCLDRGPAQRAKVVSDALEQAQRMSRAQTFRRRTPATDVGAQRYDLAACIRSKERRGGRGRGQRGLGDVQCDAAA